MEDGLALRLGVGCMEAASDWVTEFEGVAVDDGLRVGAVELLRVCVWLRVGVGVGEAVVDMLRVGVEVLLLVIVAVPEVDCDGETAPIDMINDVRMSSAQAGRLTRAIARREYQQEAQDENPEGAPQGFF